MQNIQTNNSTRVKKLERQLIAAIILLFVLIIGFLTIYDLKSGQEALAITGNYSKDTGGSLSISDWNNLPADFVDASGDTISGTLIINGKVGLNTNSPSYELTVKDFTSGPGIYIWGSEQNAELALGDETSHWAIYSDETSSDDLRFWRGSNRMVITDDGKVGIGTDNPQTALDVVGDILLRRGSESRKPITRCKVCFKFKDNNNEEKKCTGWATAGNGEQAAEDIGEGGAVDWPNHGIYIECE